MESFKYLILGAGPAGLTFANVLLENGEESFLIIEKEKEAGGLCRSCEVDGSPLDIGGGHFLDVRRPEVNEFLFKFLVEGEWNLFTRNSKIHLKDELIDHPIEANIWQLPIDEQIKYLISIAKAGCNRDEKKPEKFVDWILWKLGTEITNEYMIPYNSKVFSQNLNELGTYWLEKLPNVSFENTLRSCLEHKAYGEQPGHAKFYYPKRYGYGEIWRRMANALGNHIMYNTQVNGIDFKNNIVLTENKHKLKGEKIITTIPWKQFKFLWNMPIELQSKLKKLRHSAVYVKYYENRINSDAHWIYYPDKELDYHRILVRHNFCPNSKGYWTETNAERFNINDLSDTVFYNEYAYPLNTIEKPCIMAEVTSFARKRNVYPLGRWREHQHYNSDVTVYKAMELYNDITR